MALNIKRSSSCLTGAGPCESPRCLLAHPGGVALSEMLNVMRGRRHGFRPGRDCEPRSILRTALAAYRSCGADLPFADLARDHQAPMEGYYWRIVDHGRGTVVVWLCGICMTGAERWAVVACAADPGGLVRYELVSPAFGDPHAF